MWLLTSHRAVPYTSTLSTSLKLPMLSPNFTAVVTSVRLWWIYDYFLSPGCSRFPFNCFLHPLAKWESLPHLKQWLQYPFLLSRQLEPKGGLLLSGHLPGGALWLLFFLTSVFNASTSELVAPIAVRILFWGLRFLLPSLSACKPSDTADTDNAGDLDFSYPCSSVACSSVASTLHLSHLDLLGMGES